jgi:hypothetical protein
MPADLAPLFFAPAARARAVRAVIEWALSDCGWPYSRRLSLLLDYYLIREESDT